MFSPNEIEAMPLELEKQFKDLETRVMEDIVRRIKINGEITRAADWQIYRLQELGKAQEEIRQYIQDTLHLSDEEIDKLYSDALESGYVRDEKLYDAVGARQIPFAENEPLQQLISAVKTQTADELRNITQSLGFAVRQTDGTLAVTGLADYYQKTLDGAMLDIATGVFDYNTVLKRVVSELTNSGLRTIDYATGWSNRVPVAARRALMTGIAQVTGKINEQNAAELGTDTFEVTRHIGARPSHQVWQGRVYTHDELVSVCGLGTVEGLNGANCYHDYYPFIPGVSERTYTDEELDRLNAEENTPIEFEGKEYTKYEALQKQRRLETTMRAQRQKIHLLKEGGADEDDIIAARCRYRVTSGEYTRFSEAMGLPQQRERVTVDGLGNIGVGKYKKTVAKSARSGIIKAGRDNMGLSIEIDRFTPCLVHTRMGEIVNTKYSVAQKSELKDLKKSGWNFNWSAKDLASTDIYKLTLENDDKIQGLIAVTDFPKDRALYINLAESAPHNIGDSKEYEGVGGHLFAIAAKESLDRGYGGFLFLDAKNIDLVQYYQEKFGATLLGMPHPYRMFIDEIHANKLLGIYTLKGE